MKKMILIGEAWGAQEEAAFIKTGKVTPFIGDAGQRLEGIIKRLGRSRNEFDILNVVNERPEKNNFGVYYKDAGRKEPTEKLLKAYKELHQKVKELNPNMVLCLGNEAWKAMTGLSGIEKWRGSVVQIEGDKKVSATYHPSLLVRGGKTKDGVPVEPIMLLDFKKALRENQSVELKKLQRVRTISPTFERVIDFLNSAIGISKNKLIELAVDIETERGQISCIGIAESPTWSICIPFLDNSINGKYWKFGEQEKIIWKLKELLETPNVQVVGQNFQYDYPWILRQWGIRIANYWFDTLVGMNVCYPEFPQGLAFQTSIFTDVPFYKDDGKLHNKIKNYPRLWEYNCSDVLVTFESMQKLQNEINYFGVRDTFDFEMKMNRKMIQVAERGMLYDVNRSKELIKEAKEQILNYDKVMQEIVPPKIKTKQLKTKVKETMIQFNPKSPKQLMEWFKEQGMNIPVTKNKSGGDKESSDENSLKKLALKYPKNQLLPVLMKYRKLIKMASFLGLRYQKDKFSIKQITDPDHRIRCMYGWTEVGRLTSSKSPFWTGMNLQQVPRREMEFE